MPSRTRRTPATRGATTRAGLGWDHQQNRERLVKLHLDGKPCWWCGQPMYRDPARNPDGKALHADHSKSRSQHGNSAADRLLHDLCNKQRGDGTRDHLRPALTSAHGADDALGHRVMDWPD